MIVDLSQDLSVILGVEGVVLFVVKGTRGGIRGGDRSGCFLELIEVAFLSHRGGHCAQWGMKGMGEEGEEGATGRGPRGSVEHHSLQTARV